MPVDPFQGELEKVYDSLGLEDSGFEKMVSHYRLLVRWNRKMNLTRVVAPAEAAWRHFGESLFLFKQCHLAGKRVVDIGSGGGFPGLPVAAYDPSCHVTALEPIGKKANFLREVTRDWPNVRIEQARLEDFSGGFDWALARAVRLEDRATDLARLASSVGLLVATDSAPPGDCHDWGPAIQLPSAPERSLLVGSQRSTWNG